MTGAKSSVRNPNGPAITKDLVTNALIIKGLGMTRSPHVFLQELLQGFLQPQVSAPTELVAITGNV